MYFSAQRVNRLASEDLKRLASICESYNKKTVSTGLVRASFESLRLSQQTHPSSLR